MAKKIENNESQGNQFFQQMMQNRQAININEAIPSEPVTTKIPEVPVTPVSQSIVQPANQQNVPTQVTQEYDEEQSRRGRPRIGKKTRVRLTCTVDPDDLIGLKKIAFIERESVSNIVCDIVKQYVERNFRTVAEFDRLPEYEKRKATFE